MIELQWHAAVAHGGAPLFNKRKYQTMNVLSDEQKIEVFKKMKAAWERKDWRACVDLIASNGVLHSVMLEPAVGREVLFERFANLAKPNKDVKIHIHRIGVVDGALFVERTDELIIDGVSRTVPVVGVLEFEGEHISLWREYYDRAQMMRAAGHGPE